MQPLSIQSIDPASNQSEPTRQLTRLDSEQAVALFLPDPPDSSGRPEAVSQDCTIVDASSSSIVGRPNETITSNESAAFPTRSRNLERMTSEQALDLFLEQHSARSSQ